MATFKFYTNSSLTTEFSGTWALSQNVDGSTGMSKLQLWLGSVASGKTLQAESDPGVDQITISLTDSAPGSGHAITELKLALTEGGLPGATAGASLNLGTSISSGVGNAVTFWIGFTDATGVTGNSTELGFTTNVLREV